MPNTKLIINGEKEFPLGEGVVSFGRIPGNSISFPDDSNVSRHHAEIEFRDDDFWLFDLGSSNGTTVNGDPVKTEILLKDGDVILLGGTSEIKFEVVKDKAEENKAATAASPSEEEPKAEEKAATESEIAKDTDKASKKMPVMLLVTGGVCLLAVVCVVAAVIYSRSESKCDATAIITSPGSGETISKETEIRVKLQNEGKCVERVIFVLEDKEIASLDEEPYKASLDPSKFADYASDGQMHNLKVLLEDTKGNKIEQGGNVGLIFETLATPTPTPEETPETTPTPKKPQGKSTTIADTQEMLKQLNAKFSPALNYKCDATCLQEIQKKTAEYVSDGYFERAKGANNDLSDTINIAFVKEMNLPAPLGYFLAMSRSKFNAQKQPDGEGLWRMPNEFVVANSLNGMCGTENLSTPSQTCAARVTAWYMGKYLVPLFDGDIIYSVAAFGMSPTEAATWKSTLPANRTDFGNVIKSPKQREEVIRFLAAGIVADNPQKFGLKKDQPISELYKVAMGN